MITSEILAILSMYDKSNNTKTCALLESIQLNDKHNSAQLSSLADRCRSIEGAYLNSLPFHVNVIAAAARGRLKETAHSVILHDLLHHPTILSSFLEEIVGIDGKLFTVSDIEYPDKDRIDLSLRSREKFLIIENKVNSAQEQQGQLYRYYSLAKESANENAIIILYLNPSSYDAPSLFSRSKDGSGSEDDKDTVPIDKITVREYKHDILNWLSGLADNQVIVSDEEPYLRSALLQYIDYLEEYFRTKNKFQKLHDMIEKELRECFGLDDTQSRDSQIELLLDKKSSLEKMMSELDRLLNKLNCEKANERLGGAIAKLCNKFKGTVNFKMFNFNNPELGFDVEHDNQTIHVTVRYENQYWWRVYSTPGLDESTKDRIEEIVTPVMGPIKRGGKGTWDIYKSTSFENCILRLSQLAELFSKAPGFNIN